MRYEIRGVTYDGHPVPLDTTKTRWLAEQIAKEQADFVMNGLAVTRCLQYVTVFDTEEQQEIEEFRIKLPIKWLDSWRILAQFMAYLDRRNEPVEALGKTYPYSNALLSLETEDFMRQMNLWKEKKGIYEK